jgi:hypothetical protein
MILIFNLLLFVEGDVLWTPFLVTPVQIAGSAGEIHYRRVGKATFLTAKKKCEIPDKVVCLLIQIDIYTCGIEDLKEYANHGKIIPGQQWWMMRGRAAWWAFTKPLSFANVPMVANFTTQLLYSMMNLQRWSMNSIYPHK